MALKSPGFLRKPAGRGWDHKRPAVAALVSGGVESAALIDRLARRAVVYLLYVRHGYRWEAAELAHLRHLLREWPASRVRPLVTLSLPLRGLIGPHWAWGSAPVPGAHTPDQAMELPGRNLWLFAAAGLWCARHGVTRLAHGTLKTNPFADASPGFFRGMSVTLTRAFGRPVHLEAPLCRLTKTDVVRGLRPDLLALTFSCINPRRGRHCGRCNKCAERSQAFRAAHLPDPTNYVK